MARRLKCSGGRRIASCFGRALTGARPLRGVLSNAARLLPVRNKRLNEGVYGVMSGGFGDSLLSDFTIHKKEQNTAKFMYTHVHKHTHTHTLMDEIK